MIHYEDQLGMFRMPVVVLIGLSYFTLFRLLIISWRDAGTLSERERKGVRFATYLLVALAIGAILVNLALRFYR